MLKCIFLFTATLSMAGDNIEQKFGDVLAPDNQVTYTKQELEDILKDPAFDSSFTQTQGSSLISELTTGPLLPVIVAGRLEMALFDYEHTQLQQSPDIVSLDRSPMLKKLLEKHPKAIALLKYLHYIQD